MCIADAIQFNASASDKSGESVQAIQSLYLRGFSVGTLAEINECCVFTDRPSLGPYVIVMPGFKLDITLE